MNLARGAGSFLFYLQHGSVIISNSIRDTWLHSYLVDFVTHFDELSAHRVELIHVADHGDSNDEDILAATDGHQATKHHGNTQLPHDAANTQEQLN